jgi:exodeoxyribonuclease V gamma subunit
MAGARVRGDRSIRDEDRYLFLEALMSAGERFYISYSGQNDRDNSSRPPSVVVAELIDYVRRGFVPPGRDDTTPGIVTRHRLQSFSDEYFSGDRQSPLFSYAVENLEALESRRAGGQSRRFFIDTPLAEEAHLWQELPLQQLIRFLHNPARTFLSLRMQVHPHDPADELLEQEPFALDSLGGYALKQELTDRLLQGESCEGLYASARARGLLPPLIAGTVAYGAALAECRAFARLVAGQQGVLLEALPIAHVVQGTILCGTLEDLRQGRHIRWRCAAMKGRDRLALWCEHLVLNTLKPAGYPLESTLVCSDLTLTLRPLENAPELLADLVNVYREGLCTPLHFFPQSSWLYLQEGMTKAEERWIGADRSPAPAESADPSLTLCFAGIPVLDKEFIGLAARIYGPLLAHAAETKTA